MVAVIKTGSSVRRIFTYNENKVEEGKAQCIGAVNYPMETHLLTSQMKLSRLLNQSAQNEHVKHNSVHVSLNFDTSEANLTNEKLLRIASSYMNKIGFAQQPYLVYRHYDAGHPHIHLVSIKIRSDGSRIDMHNIGRNQSETARKEIEKNFGLVRAEDSQTKKEQTLKPMVLSKINYGTSESKKAVQAVLNYVLPNYKYKSLSELNAVLLQYSLAADRGDEESRIFKNKGLVYRMLDQEEKPIGVPLKASSFYNKPTLAFLEKRFEVNKKVPASLKNRIKNAVDLIFLKKKVSLLKLSTELQKEGIHLVLRRSSEGQIYGITYVDHQSKSVFNGSDLGKQYSAKAIQDRCNLSSNELQNRSNPKVAQVNSTKENQQQWDYKERFFKELNEGVYNADFKSTIEGICNLLTRLENESSYIPHQLKNKRKKKRNRGQSNNQ
ncbi:relaxase/mobilization nuclease domain-containing protein [Flavobacterium agrisoli]|uniref:Relaxase/mobilization nuclease domain-containing protein n=1 Tax=Flavobacterium agrisoli TaxID=2793066 RepID=A0A934PIF9_9FLAO|nr:relaxase/mobilization nuclease domain-containing protein [Flavobacterium agrisoli]MBK0368257.1 relaxase/mobilization nuclease domain-containing protein [Flavobacterium agrisoli]